MQVAYSVLSGSYYPFDDLDCPMHPAKGNHSLVLFEGTSSRHTQTDRHHPPTHTQAAARPPPCLLPASSTALRV